MITTSRQSSGPTLRTGRSPPWLEDSAKAFDEIGEIDLAIGWAKQATDFDRGHQSLKAAGYWCGLLEEHRPSEALQARVSVFRKWPSSTSAARLHKTAGKPWPDFHDEVVATLAASPSDAVLFALLTLKEPQFAWSLAPIFPASRHSPRAIGLHSSPSPLDHATFHATKCLESHCVQMFPDAFTIGRSAR